MPEQYERINAFIENQNKIAMPSLSDDQFNILNRRLIEKYNQTFTGVSKDGKKANKVQFSVKGDLTYNQLKKAYGSDFKKVKGTPSDKKSGIFEYQPKKDGLIVSFVITHGRTVEVDIGYEGVTTSK